MLRSSSLLAAVLAGACVGDLDAIPEAYDEQTPAAPCAGKCDGPSELTALTSLPATPVATLFAPYEPALGLDLLLVRQVIAARAADPTPSYPEGENPFRIRFAVYNLDSPYIAAALADAEQANVDVQVLIEHDQLDPARDYNVMDDYLVSRGFELAPSHRALDATTRVTADLIGIEGTGLMHLKTRLYRWSDASGAEHTRVITGSMNPGNLAVHNDETLHYIALPDVIARYDAKFEAVRDRAKLVNTWSDAAPMQVLFSPDGGTQAIDRIAALIDAEQEAILLAVFSLRNMSPSTGGPGIIERLIAAHQRGVTVVVITDRKQSDGVDVDGNPVYYNDGTEDKLRAGGIPVYEVVNRYSPYNAMHTKYGVFGVSRPIVVTDAGNWSRASLGSGTKRPINDESVLFIDTMRLDGGITGLRYLGNFVEILDRYDADPADVLARLQALPGWPTVDVTFNARAETLWGQTIYATGNLAELGDWTQTGAGVPLTTNGSTYPRWTSAPVALPFASRLEYKLIKRSSSGITWEAGANRTLTLDPTDRRVVGGYPVPSLATDATWR